MAKHPRARMDKDVKKPTPHGDTKRPGNIADIHKGHCIVFLFCLVIAAYLVAFVGYNTADEHYSVAIDSASALDPKTGVSFNITLGVASWSHGAYACVDPGLIVEVFYRGVQVAAGDVVGTPRTCAMPRNVAELPVVARATKVLVGGVLDNLAAEMGRGEAVFDHRLRHPDGTRCHGGKSSTTWWVLDCKGSRVGDAAVPCDSLTYTEVTYTEVVN